MNRLQTVKRRDTMIARIHPTGTYPNVPAERPPARSWKRRGGVALALLGAVAAIGLGIASLERRQAAAPAEESPAAPRTVYVTQPERAAAGEVTLPATLQPFQATDLYARVSGYLKWWSADIGARVKAGDVLAEIDTPELDQELRQAEATAKQAEADLRQSEAELAEAKADVTLAEANIERARAHLDFANGVARRDENLVRQRAVAAQDNENSVRDRDARKAELAAARADHRRRVANLTTRAALIESKRATLDSRAADVQRLRELKGFKRLTAPFDGVVVRRAAEVGMLVSAGSGPANKALFGVLQDEILRVQVSVPQTLAAPLKVGDRADVEVPEYPGRWFAAKVTRTARAVDPASRTLLVEIELPNADRLLLPGVYGRVKMTSHTAVAPLLVPTNVLLMRTDGIFVASVGAAGQVRLHRTTLGRDTGSKVEVVSGLGGEERLIVNPSDDLRDGGTVRVGQR